MIHEPDRHEPVFFEWWDDEVNYRGPVLDLLHESNEQFGMTVVLVTHERALAERYADRLAIMGDGKLLSASEITKEAAQ